MSSFSSLKEQYGGFLAPAYKITSEGDELTRSEFLISEISVDNSMGEASGACRFTLGGVYERGSRKITSAAVGKLALGSAVSVSLGYGSEFTEVFTGYIDETRLSFNDGEISLTAFCLDARALMREGACHITGKEQTAEDMAGAVLDKYSSLVSSKDITLDALEQEVSITQAGSDLDFIMKAAEARGSYFFIECGKAVIGEADDTVCVEFDWEEFGIEFSVKYLDTKFEGGGYDYLKMESFSASAEAKQTADQKELLTVSRAVQIPAHLLGESGQKILDAAAAIAKRQAIFGVITCQGIPEPKLGQKIKINKFPMSAFSAGDTFTVVAISHRMSADEGYYTEIEIEG